MILPEAPRTTGAVTAVVAAWSARSRWWRALVTVGVAGAVSCSWWWLSATSKVDATAAGLALVALGAAAVVDSVEHRLPNGLLLAAAVPVVIAVVVDELGTRSSLGGAVTGAAMSGAPLLVAHLVSPAGLGFGDVKAAMVLGGALGLGSPLVALVALVAALVVAAATAIVGRRREVPLGPSMIAGAALAALIAGATEVTPW
ncbi:MAG: prepilin peptidase [Desertimonas sp.]